MIVRNKFVARTRKRGEIDYYNAMWYESRERGKYSVQFLEGPHKGEKFNAVDVAQAQKVGQLKSTFDIRKGVNEKIPLEERFTNI